MKVYAARWVCPVASAPIENGCVAVDDAGRIAFVGSRALAPAGAVVELGDSILLPGLINAHTHLELTSFRGAINENDFFSWIRAVVSMKKHSLDESRAYDAALAGISEGIRCGTTTFADTSDSIATMDALLHAGVRGIVYQEVFGPDPRQCSESIQLLRSRVHAQRRKETDLVRAGVSPHAPYTVSDELYRAVAQYALEERLPVAVHIAESAEESDYVVRGSGPFADLLRSRRITVSPRGRSPVDVLHKTGVFATSPLLIHAIKVDETDVRLIHENGASVVHCPLSNVALGHAAAPVLAYARTNVPVALGTDSAIANQRLDVLAEARAVVPLQRTGGGGEEASRIFDAEKLLRMLTIDAARALGLEGDIGTLEAGKSADIVAFPMDNPADSPYDLILSGRTERDASLVMVKGRTLRAASSPLSI